MERPTSTLPPIKPRTYRFLRRAVFRLRWMTVGAGMAIMVPRVILPYMTDPTIGDAAEQRDGLDQLRATFLTTISHELRTPLTAARAGLGLLETSLDDRMHSDERALLVNARRNTERLSVMIDDLLAFNQLEAGTFRIEHEMLDMRAVVGAAIAAAYPLLRKHGQIVDVDLPEPLPVAGDPGRLEQVVVNLVTNGHNRTPRGTHTTISGRLASGEVTLAVRDDGPGIPAEELVRIFHRFYRRAAVEDGAGLGLAIAKAIVELHGGRMWAESQLGVGATFHVALPSVSTIEPV